MIVLLIGDKIIFLCERINSFADFGSFDVRILIKKVSGFQFILFEVLVFFSLIVSINLA